MRQDSAKVKILCLLHNNTFVKRSAMVSMFPNLNRNTINESVRYLLANGYIEERMKYIDGKNAVRVLSISDKGRRYLRKNVDKDEVKGVQNSLDYITSQKRKNDILNIYDCLRNVGIIMEDDRMGRRPRLELLTNPLAVTSKEDTENLEAMNSYGAFYSLREIREASVEKLGDGPMVMTRCLGAIVKTDTVFLVYNMGNRMIRFDRNTEQRTRDIASNLFFSSKKVTCILFGSSNISATKLLFDNPKGIHPDRFEKDAKKPKYLYSLISMTKLSDLYPEVYFVLSRKNAAKTGLLYSVYTDPTKENEVRRTILNMRPGTRTEVRYNMLVGVEKDTGRDILFALNSNLFALNWLFQINREHTADDSIILIAGTDECADLCSRLLGPKLHSVEVLRKGPTQVARYDKYAEKITDSGNRLVQPTAAEQDTDPAPDAKNAFSA